MVETALEIETVDDLIHFCPAEITIGQTKYVVLTGYEGTGGCFWCGGKLKGKLKRYCYGHMREYYDHFNWGYASFEALERANRQCQNCGSLANLKVHHIIPLNGEPRAFSAFNLPWNLIVLCHNCHKEIHRVMRPPKTSKVADIFELAKAKGQLVMELGA